MIIRVNSESHDLPEQWQEETLLSVLREYLGLVGTKFGCGQGQCGACTVIIDGEAIRSCQMSVQDATNVMIRTIESLEQNGELHPVQQAWLDQKVPQCGYCQSGQIMSAVALLEANPSPSSYDIENAMSGNLCRCGTYDRLRKAIAQMVEA